MARSHYRIKLTETNSPAEVIRDGVDITEGITAIDIHAERGKTTVVLTERPVSVEIDAVGSETSTKETLDLPGIHPNQAQIGDYIDPSVAN